MTPMTPLEQAVAAWGRYRDPDEVIRRQVQFDDAAALGATGAFSNSNIALITGLDVSVVGKITGKRDNTGGRLNPASLDSIHELAMVWRRHRVIDVSCLIAAVNLGTSCAMISKLSGATRTSLYDKMKEAKA